MDQFGSITPATALILCLIIGPVLYYIRRARRDHSKIYVRRIPGIDAIDEAVGRAAELGRPVSFTPGLTTLSPLLYAVLGALYHVARKTARYSVRLLVAQNQPDVMAISDEVIKDAYREENRLNNFDARNSIYLSDEQFAYAAGYIGMVQRENVGSTFLFGYFAAESLILAEAGQQVGAMQVAASISPEQATFFITTCDYTLIGEELFATSAYLTREPVQLGSLYGQDRAKLLFFVSVVVGVLIATWNSYAGEANSIPNLDYFLELDFYSLLAPLLRLLNPTVYIP